MFYETRTPAFERGHSEEIPIERVSKQVMMGLNAADLNRCQGRHFSGTSIVSLTTQNLLEHYGEKASLLDVLILLITLCVC